MGIVRSTWLIVLLPFVSSLLLVLLGKRMPGRGAPLGILAVAVAFVLSLFTLGHFVGGGGPYERTFALAPAGDLTLEAGW